MSLEEHDHAPFLLINFEESIPTRRELVKEAKSTLNTTELKELQNETLAHLWSTCPLSHTQLQRPVVSDCEGFLYNKDAVLQYLLPAKASTLNKEDCEKILQGRVKGLKDVVEVIFQAEAATSTDPEKWICPMTSKQFGPAVKAVYLVPCGHAFSQEAIKEMKTETCPQCSQPYGSDNIIPVFPALKTERDALKKRMEKLKGNGLTHSLKYSVNSTKKRKKARTNLQMESRPADTATSKPNTLTGFQEASDDNNPMVVGSISGGAGQPVQKRPAADSRPLLDAAAGSADTIRTTSTSVPVSSSFSTVKNAATARLTAKVLHEESERKKRRVMLPNSSENANLQSLFTRKGAEGMQTMTGDRGKQSCDADFMTRGYSMRG